MLISDKVDFIAKKIIKGRCTLQNKMIIIRAN